MAGSVPEPEAVPAALPELLQRMGAARQVSAGDARSLVVAGGATPVPPRSEEEVLRWVAAEYGVEFSTLDGAEPDPQVLSLFPTRVLLKNELPPLRRPNPTV